MSAGNSKHLEYIIKIARRPRAVLDSSEKNPSVTLFMTSSELMPCPTIGSPLHPSNGPNSPLLDGRWTINRSQENFRAGFYLHSFPTSGRGCISSV
jgi:hypothetical protein